MIRESLLVLIVCWSGVMGCHDDADDILSPSTPARSGVFASGATNLVAGDTNGAIDIFVRDYDRGTTVRVSVATGGAEANFLSRDPVISKDGRVVAFCTRASNLVAGDTNGLEDIFIRDLQIGETRRVSLSTAGSQASGSSMFPSISSDGRYVSFNSTASDLVAGDTNGVIDIFVRDTVGGVTTRVSLATGGAQGNGHADQSSVSEDGRYVAFSSSASNLVAGDTNGSDDIFVQDRQTSTTTRVSVATGGPQGNGDSGQPRISGDGRYVVFRSASTNLVGGDTNAAQDIFVHDRQTGATSRVSVATAGTQGNGVSNSGSISSDGRYVAFESDATNLVAIDANATTDVFLRDRVAGTTMRVSQGAGGAEANDQSQLSAVAPNGGVVAFRSRASNLVPADSNGVDDIFIYDCVAATLQLFSVSSAGIQGDGASDAPWISGP